MDVRRADMQPVVVEHQGTCRSYFMFPKESMRGDTEGSYLELVGEFEIEPGERLAPHRHDSHEFYYILRGTPVVQVAAEQRRLVPGDLVHIPRMATHSIWAEDGEPFRAFAFAVSFQPPGAEPEHVPFQSVPVYHEADKPLSNSVVSD